METSQIHDTMIKRMVVSIQDSTVVLYIYGTEFRIPYVFADGATLNERKSYLYKMLKPLIVSMDEISENDTVFVELLLENCIGKILTCEEKRVGA